MNHHDAIDRQELPDEIWSLISSLFNTPLHLFGVTCRCLNSKRLIEVKRAAGRLRDLEVIAELEAFTQEQHRKDD